MSATLFVPGGALEADGLHALEHDGHKIVLCRLGDDYYALENRCPHVAIPIDSGRLTGHVLECPLHGGTLDVRDGSPLGHPIRRPARTYPVRSVPGGLEITLGD